MKLLQTRLKEFLNGTGYSAYITKSEHDYSLEKPVEARIWDKIYLPHDAVISAENYEKLEIKIWAQIHEWILRENKTVKYIYKRIMDAAGDELEKMDYRILIERINSTNLYKVFTVYNGSGVADGWTAFTVEGLCDNVINWAKEKYKEWSKRKGGDKNESISN
jgi:hypothetical protein